MTDDDYTRITGIEICMQHGLFGMVPKEHFRGFRAEIYSPKSGTQYQDFGIMDATGNLEVCEGSDITIEEELMYFTVYSDINDAEGLVFESWLGTEYSYRANGDESSPRERLGGRPIGFRVVQGDGALPNQPLLIAIVYNACNCPASNYMSNA